MTGRLSLSCLGAALLFAGAGAAAQTAPSVGKDRTHAARVDRLMAALPPDDTPGTPDAPDEAHLARVKALIAANPQKAPAIRAASDAQGRCNARLNQGRAELTVRRAADTMSDAQLDQLTAFYSGPDYAGISGEPGEAKIKELAARYPLMEFAEAMKKAFDDEFDTLIQGFAKCDAEFDSSLAQAGVTPPE